MFRRLENRVATLARNLVSDNFSASICKECGTNYPTVFGSSEVRRRFDELRRYRIRKPDVLAPPVEQNACQVSIVCAH